MEPIKKYTFKKELPQEFEIVDIGKLYHRYRRTLTTPHQAGFYHIIWFQKGSPRHLVDFKYVEIKPGTFLFLNRDTVHSFDSRIPFEGKAILFTDSFFSETEADASFLRSSAAFNNLFTFSMLDAAEAPEALVQMFQQMEGELLNNRDAYQSQILRSILRSFLVISERGLQQTIPETAALDPDLHHVRRFKELLDAHYKTKKLVTDYTALMTITEKRLNKATAKILGLQPKQLITERVVLEAKRLLAHTPFSVKEIGFGLGFDEPTNFIKFFRKNTGYTPALFRDDLAVEQKYHQ